MKTTLNKSTLLMALALSCSILSTYGQSLLATKHYTTTGSYENAFDVHVAGDGRVYVGGFKEISGADYDAIMISYTSSGTQNWVSSYAGSSSLTDIIRAVTSYSVGSGTVIYGAGDAATTTGGDDALLIKYNQSGVQQWAATWNNTGFTQEIANAVTVDGSGNIYLCGRTSANGGDLFALKYNSSGTLQWSITYNSSGTQDDAPQFMKINSAGTYLYITSVRTLSSTNHDAVLQKISTSTGAISWTSVWDNTLTNDLDETYSLDLDNNENIYTVGQTQTASNGLDALMLQYSSSGTLLFANTWNNASYNLDDVLASVDVTHATHTPLVYVTGYTQINTASNDADYLTMKYSGTVSAPVWTSTYDGAGTGCPTANDDWAYMIMADASLGKVYVTGRTYETSASLNATTLRYDASTGTQEWVDSYDRGGTDNTPATKYPMDLQYDACHGVNSVYITGYTHESTSGTPYDATTLMYGNTGSCLKPAPGTTYGSTAVSGHSLIYPHPFSNSTTFYCGRDDIKDATFIIFDLTGREVKRIEHLDAGKFSIDSKELNTGAYFYKFLQDHEMISTGQLLIQK